MQQIGDLLGHFFATVLAIALALVIIVFVVWLLRRIFEQEPLELIQFLMRLIAPLGPPRRAPVNVEFRDAVDELVMFRRYVNGSLHNGVGPAVELHEGYFHGCDPDLIKPGTTVHVSVQGGLLQETLRVQLDYKKDALFVKSRHKLTEMIARINQSPE